MADGIAVDGVTKSFGKVAVGPFDLYLQPGTTAAVVGANGAGKSTLISLIAGETLPTAGRVFVNGAAPTDAEAKAAVAVVFDTPDFYDDLSLHDHIEYVSRLHASPALAERAVEVCDRFRLSARLRDLPRRFSFGMRKKAGLVLAYARPFHFLVLDEPSNGLDGEGLRELRSLLEENGAAGRAALFSTHDPRLREIAHQEFALSPT